MAMMEHVLTAYRANVFFAQRLVAELTAVQMVSQPLPKMNHAAWVLGHLAMPRAWMKEELKLAGDLPAGWAEKFNMGSVPVSDVGFYPGKAELLKEFEETHRQIEGAFRKLTDADLMKATGGDALRAVFPLAGDSIVAMITTHEGFHLGQLSAWRRAMGLPGIFN